MRVLPPPFRRVLAPAGRLVSLAFVASFALAPATIAQHDAARDAAHQGTCTTSYWTGTMGTAPHDRPVLLAIPPAAGCDSVESRLRMPGAHANDFPLASVTATHDSVAFQVLGAGGPMRFAGAVDARDAAASRLTGAFFRGPRAVPASFTRVASRPAELDTSLIAGGARADLRWPMPRGWSAEKLMLPLPKEFVPDLPLTGWEVMRSAPHFADTTSAGYWSYAFAWWMPADSGTAHETDAAVLQDQLRRYFRGLAAFGDVPAARRDSTVVTLARRGPGSGAPGMFFDGMATIFDFANGGRAVQLTVVARVLSCERQARTAVIVGVAPAAATDDASRRALSLPATFACGA